EASLLQVFREAEFVATATSRSFYHTLEQELPRLLAAPPQLDPRLLTYFLLGAVYFNAIGRAVWGLQHQPLPTVVELLLHGMAPAAAPPGLWRLPPELPELPEPDLRAAKVEEGFRPISGGELTRQRLLAAAEGLFGLLGYQECTISRITEAAPAGLGTFYLHFASKQELLAELVRGTREHLKRYVARGAARAGHRLSAEVLGLRAFLRFLGRHGAMYRVVREAEFVEQQIGLGYYLDIAEGYRQSLAQGMAAGQVRELDPFSLGLALMGIGHFLGQRWGVEPGAPVPAPVQSAMVELCMRGVLGVAGGEPAPGRPGEGEVP
ncbi:MAG: TetR/AcrR family transcriptional regulator, partial [Deltaproteobacteria bacterium]|nr:TetR/AcrR family transcriptional regulator [Deltaproteobacteria bacterium]